jgi:uncharacterized RDD family membrane protein YckC
MSGESPRWLPPTDGPGETGSGAPSPSPASTAPWPGEAAGAHAVSAAGRPAAWWPRVGAAVIDAFVRLALVLAGALVGAVFYAEGQQAGEAGVIGGIVVGAIAGLVYAPVMIARTNGQTVGHKAVDTRIVRRSGAPLSGGGAAVREVAVKWLLIDVIGGFLVIPTLVNYLWPLWDENNEALHDKICSTRVVEA